MSAYVIANLTQTSEGEGIRTYLEGIDATLEPFGGSFLIHGAPPEVLEGSWSGDTIMIGFPSLESARAWYRSPAYVELKPHRTAHFEGAVVLIEGVPEGHRSAEILER